MSFRSTQVVGHCCGAAVAVGGAVDAGAAVGVAAGAGAAVGAATGDGAAVGVVAAPPCNGVLSSVARLSSTLPEAWPRCASIQATTSRYCRSVNDPSAASGMVALV